MKPVFCSLGLQTPRRMGRFLTALLLSVLFAFFSLAMLSCGKKDTTSGPPPAPNAPTLISPTNGALSVATNPILSWHASGGAASYALQLSDTSTFVRFEVDTSGILDTTYQVNNLTNLRVYYWRVRATNSTGNSNWSVVWSFTTINP